MTGWKRVTIWASAVLIGLALVGFGAYLAVRDLDRADKLASVVGVFLAMAGLGLSGFGTVLARRALQSPTKPAGRQTVERVHAKAGVDVVDAVGGSVRFGAAQTPAAGGRSAPSAPPEPSGEQLVRDVESGGHIRIIRGVGGDVDGGS